EGGGGGGVGGGGVPDDGWCVVVTVGAQRPAQAGIIVVVPPPARQAPPMGAVAGLAPRAAAGGLPTGSEHAGVDRSERGGGEGGEHARVDGDRLGGAFATGKSGADELVGVGPVGLGTRRADRGAAIPAGDVDRVVRQVASVQVAEDLTSRSVDIAGGATQPDGPDAPARG